ncbi:MAG: hypothetical protein ACMZ66_13205 [Thalassospira sp.]|uniref:DUF7483 domain-containing protein n=1 Tax=Thalassospira sp. TaxID=1912094 RepID=UPI003A86A8E8
MSLLMENSVAKIGCGDPGDPIPFAALLEGNNYLQFPAAGASTKKALFNLWVKGVSDAFNSYIYSSPDLAGSSYFYLGHSGNQTRIIHRDVSNQFDLSVEGFARDGAAFRNLHLEIDATQPVAEDRVKLWVNGMLVTLTGTFPALDYAMTKLGGTAHQYVSSWVGSFGTPAGGPGHYAANVAYGDDPDAYSFADFGRFNAQGDWVPKAVSDLSGLRYFLPFSDPANMGANLAGADLVETGAVAQSADTPTSFKHFSFDMLRFWNSYTGALATSEGGYAHSSTNSIAEKGGTVNRVISRGKIYAEFKAELTGYGSNFCGIGTISAIDDQKPGERNDTVLWLDGGNLRQGGAATAHGSALTTSSDVMRMAINADTKEVWFGLNNTWFGGGDPENGINPSATGLADEIIIASYAYSDELLKLSANLGQIAFEFAPPAGFSGLNSAENSFDCPAILKPDDYVTGRITIGGAAVADLPWNPLVEKTLSLSVRLDGDYSRRVSTSVRGSGLCFEIDLTTGEIPCSMAFTSTGVTFGADDEYQGTCLHLFWRVSALAGMDIPDVFNHVNGTPSLVNTSLGGVKEYGWLLPIAGGDIRTFHNGLDADQYLRLNETQGYQTDAGWCDRTANTVTYGGSLVSGQYLPVIWRGIPQFSNFAMKKGNGVADGPRFVRDFTSLIDILKNADTTAETVLLDKLRDPFNPAENILNLSTAVQPNIQANNKADLVSDGTKVRGSGGALNGNGNRITSASWAITPGKFATAQ